MEQENWYKADNVSKVFLATYNQRDTRSLRVSCTLTEKIDPVKLTEALEQTMKLRNMYQVRIRRGIFWHYLEHTDYIPKVTEEHERPCPLLYGKNYKGTVHYSVTYFGRRINLEMFHALTDGTGALDLLSILVVNYLKLVHPDELADVSAGFSSAEGELEQDSFSKFYENDDSQSESGQKAYHIRGLKLPYDQLQFIKVTMPADKVISLSKQSGAGLTSYIGARLMTAIYHDMPAVKRDLPVTVSIPVNLRNYYGTETARNFFNSVSVSHIFKGDETVEDLAKELDIQLKKSLTPENIRHQMNHFQKIERIMAIRIVPLFVKQPVVRHFSLKEAENISAVVSNIGKISIPDEIRCYCDDFEVYCSHSELYMSLCSYNGKLVMGITNGRRNTGVIREFVSGFAADGIETQIEATEVVR